MQRLLGHSVDAHVASAWLVLVYCGLAQGVVQHTHDDELLTHVRAIQLGHTHVQSHVPVMQELQYNMHVGQHTWPAYTAQIVPQCVVHLHI